MNVLELTNGEVEFSFSDKTYKVKQLSIVELCLETEKEILEEHSARMMSQASMLQGKDKIDYMVRATKEYPNDQELTQLVEQRTKTVRGLSKLMFKTLNKCQKVSQEESDIVAFSEKYNVLSFAILQYAQNGIVMKDEEEIKNLLDPDKKK